MITHPQLACTVYLLMSFQKIILTEIVVLPGNYHRLYGNDPYFTGYDDYFDADAGLFGSYKASSETAATF